MANQICNWLFPAFSPAGGMWTWPCLSVDGQGSTQLTTPPSTTGVSGVPLLIQPIITLLNIFGLLDLLYVGVVTATVTAGTAVIVAGGTGLVALGVATFLTLTLTGSGTSTITFSATGHTSVSAQVTLI